MALLICLIQMLKTRLKPTLMVTLKNNLAIYAMYASKLGQSIKVHTQNFVTHFKDKRPDITHSGRCYEAKTNLNQVS